MTEITVAQYREYIATGGKSGVSKYKNVRMVYQGHGFDSKAELAFYMRLLLLQASGVVRKIYRQVPIHLPALNGVRGTIYRLDFLVTMNAPYQPEDHLDVKGKDTQTSKVKRSVASHVLQAPIKLVLMDRHGNFDWTPTKALPNHPR